MVNLIVDHPMSSVERGKNDRIVNDTKKGIVRTRDIPSSFHSNIESNHQL